jgi:hypothetical protein
VFHQASTSFPKLRKDSISFPKLPKLHEFSPSFPKFPKASQSFKQLPLSFQNLPRNCKLILFALVKKSTNQYSIPSWVFLWIHWFNRL